MRFVPIPYKPHLKPALFDRQPTSELRDECLIDARGLRSVSLVVPTRTHLVRTARDRLMTSDPDIEVSLRISQSQIGMAIEEALANAIFHGNLEIASSLKEDGSSRFWDLAQDRQARRPWKDRVVRIQKLVCSLGVWITIADEGPGFDTHQATAAALDSISPLSSGRGLVMMRAFTNELFFSKCGNSVTLVFYATSQVRQPEVPAIISRTLLSHK